MEQKIKNRIEMIGYELTFKKKQLEALTKDLKEAVAKYDTYSIITFVPGYVRQIEELDREIKALEEQERMLVWIAKEDGNA